MTEDEEKRAMVEVATLRVRKGLAELMAEVHSMAELVMSEGPDVEDDTEDADAIARELLEIKRELRQLSFRVRVAGRRSTQRPGKVRR
jgi:hypothetical protein